MTRKPRVTIRKYNGDDAYSWAIFVDGRVVNGLTGLNREQARYYKAQVLAQYGAKPHTR